MIVFYLLIDCTTLTFAELPVAVAGKPLKKFVLILKWDLIVSSGSNMKAFSPSSTSRAISSSSSQNDNINIDDILNDLSHLPSPIVVSSSKNIQSVPSSSVRSNGVPATDQFSNQKLSVSPGMLLVFIILHILDGSFR
jgi:hypothetical protein